MTLPTPAIIGLSAWSVFALIVIACSVFACIRRQYNIKNKAKPRIIYNSSGVLAPHSGIDFYNVNEICVGDVRLVRKPISYAMGMDAYCYSNGVDGPSQPGFCYPDNGGSYPGGSGCDSFGAGGSCDSGGGGCDSGGGGCDSGGGGGGCDSGGGLD